MRIDRKQAISENLLYLLVWTAILLVPVLNSKMMAEPHVSLENILIAWQQIAPYLVIFLIHNGIIAPRFMLTHRYALYVTIDLALIAGVFWLVDLYEQLFVPALPAAGADEQLAGTLRRASFSNLQLYWNVILGFFMTGANTGIKLMYQSIRDEQEMEALKRQNLQAEMDYLKYQINPHFFMNTLNNIHALIDIDPEQSKRAVIELSKMMRHVLYDSGRERVPLAQELQFLENYIGLMRLRYTDNVEIGTSYPEPPAGATLPPLILIVFVENAFKHGISYNRPSFVRVELGWSSGRLEARFDNSRHDAPGEPPRSGQGIGLENVRKRLDLLYGARNYTLRIDDRDPAVYSVRLSIPMDHAPLPCH